LSASSDFEQGRRGCGGGAAACPGLKNFRANSVFRASASCSNFLNDKKYIFNTVNSVQTLFSGQRQVAQKSLLIKLFQYSKKFQGNSVFQGKRKLLKYPD